ncbi:TetR/AcrR family transcriptional regulator [Microbacterium imperiale]|uniref:TetR family transcriptional regulator n=1 Tax=Microbacterium imperiale TaxID=33884 RepID=A0A9W6M2S7_9MICO|nr:TetR/AcrR family transcriptional regulator [Microbacterium imperiale]MBP2421984.1 AcrR family transcriptional regulator [Microbacterium imperiale]MDS0200142.1 TetR/AcrR family transcriptional regulator [Microbacterium imperiale]BFE39291.1 TetR/AcrR family transcriptional regulator [Microbacterium imperiale]GLJ79843.1 TetR family transcriptional regulator [Microbacterium imperiale]
MSTDDRAAVGRPGAYAKGVARRREILDRAIEVFQERGLQGTSLRRIAEAIGVSHAALLHYFESREQLLVAVYEHAEAQRDARDRPPSATAVGVMTRAAVDNAEVPGLVELYSTLVAGALEAGSEHGKAFFTARFERVRAQLTQRLRDEQSAGTVRDDVPAEQLAALLVAASDGLQIQWLLEPSIELERTLASLSVLLRPA